MIKGCTKRVVVVKDVQSDIFEEAYFILRPGTNKNKAQTRENDIITEANRLVVGKSDFCDTHHVTLKKENKAKRRGRDVLFFIFGVVVSVVGSVAFTVIGL